MKIWLVYFLLLISIYKIAALLLEKMEYLKNRVKLNSSISDINDSFLASIVIR